MKNWLILAGCVVTCAVLPLIANNYTLRLLTTMLMYVILAQSWNFIGGLAGYPSFATAAFFGLGAYTSAVLQSHHVPIFAAWSAAALSAMLFAALIGGAILHLRGHYFAIASLVVAEVLREIINTTPITGGGMGLNLPVSHGSISAQAHFFYFAMLAVAVLCMSTAITVRGSKLGFGLRCIQQNEDAANVLGVNAYMYKTAAFMLSAIYVGVAGGIYASWVHYIEPPDVFDVMLAIKPLVMALLGGIGTLFGPPVGAVILMVLEEVVWRNFLTVHAAMLGVVIVALVLFLPNGLLPLLRSCLDRLRGAS